LSQSGRVNKDTCLFVITSHEKELGETTDENTKQQKDCKSLNSKTPNDKDCMQVLNTLPLLGSQKMT
jgi:hypothetical protein